MVARMVGSVLLQSALLTRPSRRPTPMRCTWLLRVRLRLFLIVLIRLSQLGWARSRPSMNSCCIPPCARHARRTDSTCWSRRGCYDAPYSSRIYPRVFNPRDTVVALVVRLASPSSYTGTSSYACTLLCARAVYMHVHALFAHAPLFTRLRVHVSCSHHVGVHVCVHVGFVRVCTSDLS